MLLADCEVKDDRLWHYGRLWVPETSGLRVEVIKAFHDKPSGGHNGKVKIYTALNVAYFWPGMLDDIRRFVRNCHVCKRSKAFRNIYAGGLLQLNVPERP